MNLQAKRIIVGITGGIAAYKSIELIRQLRKQGAEVRVVMTEAVTNFVTPLTLQAISGNMVHGSLFDLEAELGMGHIELAKWADLIMIAPATADFIARLNAGMANDLLTSVCLASANTIVLAPAMNQQMYRNQITQSNINSLQQRGILVVGPDSGEQACGDIGFGRMVEPNAIVSYLSKYFTPQIQDCINLKVAITAGPTQEKIDPVRYITNYSSGKMGFALATALANRGAEVTLIAGPVSLATPNNVKRIDVVSAVDMHKVALDVAVKQDMFIGCAAVADYRVAEVMEQKIKKEDDNQQLNLQLMKNPDIIAEIGHLAQNRPFVVGFAAETENVAQYALKKLTSKNLDMICANDVSSAQAGFNVDLNALQVFWEQGSQQLPQMNKQELADKLVDIILSRFKYK